MAKEMKVALIGLDTSHSIEFTKLIQGEAPAGQRVEGLRVVSCLRFPTPFQNDEGLDAREKQLTAWGVKVTRSFEEAIQGVDGFLLEINDPAFHIPYFEKVAALGKPVFLDKPLATNFDEGKKIVELARKHGTKVWCSSSLRFMNSLQSLLMEIPMADRRFANVYGPLGKAPAGSSVVWYGVHTIEMLVAIMGCGAATVTAKADAQGVVAHVQYPDGRRGVAEVNQNLWLYGGRILTPKFARNFTHEGETLYYNLLKRIADFLATGKAPVSLEESLEVQAILEAMDDSTSTGRECKVKR